MERIRVRCDGFSTTFEVVDNYLQRTFGTLKNPSGPDFIKYQMTNWDNSQFMDYQSRVAFLVPYESYDFRFNKRIIPDEKSVTKATKNFMKDYPEATGEQYEKVEGKFRELLTEKRLSKAKMRIYLPIRTMFLGGEWHWITDYKMSNLERSLSIKTTYPCMAWERYNGEQLGIIKSVPEEKPFWMKNQEAKEALAAAREKFEFTNDEYYVKLYEVLNGEITQDEYDEYLEATEDYFNNQN